MITKQQALEFIDEISKLHVIYLDIPCGYAYIDKEEDEYRAWADEHTLEALVTEIIKDNMGTTLLMDFNKIPVDISMLKVGQTYKVTFNEAQITYKVVFNEAQITDELTKIDDNNVYFRRHYPIKIQSIREIYKVNEHV